MERGKVSSLSRDATIRRRDLFIKALRKGQGFIII